MNPLKRHELLYLISQLRSVGLSQKEIAHTLQISQQRVSYALKKIKEAYMEEEEWYLNWFVKIHKLNGTLLNVVVNVWRGKNEPNEKYIF